MAKDVIMRGLDKIITGSGKEVDLDNIQSTARPSIHWLLVGGGGGGGFSLEGGGGAGGLITSWPTDQCGGLTTPRNPFSANIGQVFTIKVGAGGSGVQNGSMSDHSGQDSWIQLDGTEMFRALGGGSAQHWASTRFQDGGSGGGVRNGTQSDAGVAIAGTYDKQGFDGGFANGGGFGGGGGGAGAKGQDASSSVAIGAGGSGLATTLATAAQHGQESGGQYYLAGGGGSGGGSHSSAGNGGAGGLGGGAAGSNSGVGFSAPANMGGGGGGAYYHWNGVNHTGGAGGSGVAILAIPTTVYTGTTTGSPTVKTAPLNGEAYTLLVYTADGTYTA